MSGKASGTYEIMPDVLDLATLHPRLVEMIHKLLKHQKVICEYDTGSIFLNWNGLRVKPELGKVALDSNNKSHS